MPRFHPQAQKGRLPKRAATPWTPVKVLMFPAETRHRNHHEEHCDKKEWRQEQTQDARVAFCTSGTLVAASRSGDPG